MKSLFKYNFSLQDILKCFTLYISRQDATLRQLLISYTAEGKTWTVEFRWNVNLLKWWKKFTTQKISIFQPKGKVSLVIN